MQEQSILLVLHCRLTLLSHLEPLCRDDFLHVMNFFLCYVMFRNHPYVIEQFVLVFLAESAQCIIRTIS